MIKQLFISIFTKRKYFIREKFWLLVFDRLICFRRSPTRFGCLLQNVFHEAACLWQEKKCGHSTLKTNARIPLESSMMSIGCHLISVLWYRISILTNMRQKKGLAYPTSLPLNFVWSPIALILATLQFCNKQLFSVEIDKKMSCLKII